MHLPPCYRRHLGSGTPCLTAVLAICLLALIPTAASADPPSALESLTGRTLGGMQFWADELLFRGWRIQRNTVDDHCRLLDAENVRHGDGTFEQCRAKLEEIKRRQQLPPMRGHVVLVLHGLFRTRNSMAGLCEYLRRQGGLTVLDVGYPSTRRDVAGHARSLASIVDHLGDVESISFVGHSMGNIVVRHYLADRARREAGRDRPAGQSIDPVPKQPKLYRFVMLAPPNHGSLAAFALEDNNALKAITGSAVQQLGVDWARLEGRLATPDFPFGIIAGGKSDGSGYNPLLIGDDDGTVAVSTTRLAGAADFVVVPALHSFCMNDDKVRQYTLRFLQRGYFISPQQRHPIPANPPTR